MSRFFKDFIENKKWKQIKKGDWIVLALAGVLLLVISLPDGGGAGAAPQENAAAAQTPPSPEDTTGEEEAYVTYLEEKLERVLARIDGAGEVAVMITVSDAGEYVVEKDAKRTKSEMEEADSSGGSRASKDTAYEEETVYVENGDGTYPYVQREKLPTVVGVVVVAEGGGNARVVSDISEAIQALLPVEVHRIKVVKMESREEQR